MNEDTGKIREYDKIPKKERNGWSEPFHVGMELEVLGIKMKIIKIKKLRGEIHLAHPGYSDKTR